MNVTRVHTEGGSHIEPPLDPAWDQPTKLTWHAAVVTHDTCIAIRIHHRDGRYSLQLGTLPTGQTSTGGRDFHDTWDFLVGVKLGAEHARAIDPPQDPATA